MKWDKHIPSLGIYGINDRNDLEFPEESHDHGVVLMDQGRIVQAVQLERYTGKKHDHRLKDYLIPLLQEMGLGKTKFDLAFSNNVLGQAFISSNGKIRLEGPPTNSVEAEAQVGQSWWFDHMRPAWLVNHELAHVFSALPFYPDLLENALLVHFDGGGSRSNFSAFVARQGKIRLVEADWKMKYLTALFNANALSFGIIGATKSEQLSVPGKLMGLAAYGSYDESIEKWLIDHAFFADHWGSKEAIRQSALIHFGVSLNQLDAKDPFCQDVVATMHEIFVRETYIRILKLAQEHQCENLVFTGGSALNIVLNARLVRSGLFKQIMVPPCTNDSGLALGAAAFLEWKKHGSIARHSPYQNHWKNKLVDAHDQNLSVARVAAMIVDGKIIGLFSGKGEMGPRALGNRSLLCRADDPVLAQRLSMDIKKREWYRPLAPLMKKKWLPYFTGEAPQSDLGRYMLDEFAILPDKRSEIEGAVHVDGTARIQFFTQADEHPFLWKLLSLLEEQYGIKCLINTSFNVRGKPMVERASEAQKQGSEMGLDAVLIDPTG